MKIRSAEFITSAVTPPQYPDADVPEIAFGGRSNVGKSSLINTLVNRKRLVKTSSRPGRTQLINFFRVNDAFNLVDLPGYGYAKVPVAVKKKWGPMIETYLSSRTNLKGMVLIMDIRRVPRKEEMDFFAWLDLHGVTAIPVITKADKLSKNKQKTQLALISKTVGISREKLIPFSAKTRQGLDILWEAIERAIMLP